MKLEGRPKEITTKRKKGREVNWRERKKEKEWSRFDSREIWRKLCFFFLPPFRPPARCGGWGGGERWPTYPTIRISDDVKRMKASRDRIVDSISPTNIDVVIFSLLHWRGGGGGLETWFLMVELTSPLVNYRKHACYIICKIY